MAEDKFIMQLKAGDRQAFDTLVETYQSQVVNMAYGLLSDREDALDAAQEVFIKVYRSISSFRGESALSTWIFRITRNVCTDFLRKRKYETVSMDQEDDEKPKMELGDTTHAPEQVVEQTQMQRMVREAIAQMDENHRAVITLFDIEGMSYDEIAQILECTVGTVKSRLARAREKLKQFFIENREQIL